MNLVARNLGDYLLLNLFISSTPETKVEDAMTNELVAEVKKSYPVYQESPAVRTVRDMLVAEGYVEGDALTKKGEFRCIQMLQSGRKKVNFEELASQQGISGLLALLNATTNALKERIASKKEFKPTDKVVELLSGCADTLDTLAGVEVVEETVS